MTIRASDLLDPLPLCQVLFEISEHATAVVIARISTGLQITVVGGPLGTYELRMTPEQVERGECSLIDLLAGYLRRDVLRDHKRAYPRKPPKRNRKKSP